MSATDLVPAALLEVLHDVLDADPSDAVTRLALADALEDLGDAVAARGQRWQVLHGKWPAPVTSAPPVWRWWPGSAQVDSPDDVPPGVFGLLSPGTVDGRIGRYHPSRRAAEGDLAAALEALDVREAVLAGYDARPCPRCGERKAVYSGRDHACDGCGGRWGS